MVEKFYAHSCEGEPPENWHRLEEHLKNFTKMAQRNSTKDLNMVVRA